jgi:NDP-sugar pyrophosphorylase family protein
MPHTEKIPKPMLKVGGTPMLERIVNGFVAHGFRKFIMAVNYKAEMITDYFSDGAKFGADISYVHEDKRMGTAGALSLIEERFDKPFFVMNGDVLTDCNFEMMLDFHNVEKSTVTMAVREYDMQVPFGVVNLQQRQISTIDEKPVHSFFVNAGIYVLEPKVFDYIQSGAFTDMPSVVQAMVDDGHKASAFPLRETWLDVGRDEDYRLAEEQYKEGRS